jgi:hypothetical protein
MINNCIYSQMQIAFSLIACRLARIADVDVLTMAATPVESSDDAHVLRMVMQGGHV